MSLPCVLLTPACALQETLSLRATAGQGAGLTSENGYSRGRTTGSPAQRGKEGWAGLGKAGRAEEIHICFWRLPALLPPGAPGEGKLTSGRGAGI